MQKVEYKESPSPHVVIENFLPTLGARKCLNEAQQLEPVFMPAWAQGVPFQHDITDDCEECTQVKSKRLNTRSNDLVYLDEHYQGKRNESAILSQMDLVLQSASFINTFKTLPNMFPIVAQTTHMESILSSYGMCDFYGWHKDTESTRCYCGQIDPPQQQRIITCVLHFNTEPQQYQGGELILSGETIKDQLAYKPVHNTAIFFQSDQCVHAVDETIYEGGFKDSRFSINSWLGFGDEERISHEELNTAFKYR